MDGTFKPYVVKAKLDGVELRVVDCRRGYRWNTDKHGTPGERGENVKKHGRQSIADSVTCLCTVPEVKKLEAIGDKARVTWIHPLLKPIDGTVEDLDIPATVGIWGYFQVTFGFVETNDPTKQATKQTNVSIPTSKAKAGNIFDKLAGDLDDLDDIPTADGNAFTGAFDDMDAAFADIDDTFGDMITGDAGWQDLARGLDALVETANDFITAAQAVEAEIGGMADAIQTAPALLVETVRDAVDGAKSAAGTVASFVTQAPSDIFGMMMDAGLAINEDTVVALMQDNGITDPFAIPAGITLSIPVAA